VGGAGRIKRIASTRILERGQTRGHFVGSCFLEGGWGGRSCINGVSVRRKKSQSKDFARCKVSGGRRRSYLKISGGRGGRGSPSVAKVRKYTGAGGTETGGQQQTKKTNCVCGQGCRRPP